MSDKIAGVLPILHTPFNHRDEIDCESLQREIDWAFAVGADGICTAMVSEILRLTSEERLRLNAMIVEMSQGRGTVVASVGAESTRQAVLYAHAATEAGCHAIMAIPPVTTAWNETTLEHYFQTLAECTDLPLIVQDASSYVGKSIPIDFSIRLLDRYGPEKILFKPEGTPVGPNLSALRDASGSRARMFDGSGGMYLIDAFRRGVIGTMPGVDLLDGVVALWRALQQGDESTAYRISFPLSAVVALQIQAGLDGFLAIEKYLMVRRGLFATDRRRLPYAWSLDPETAAEVDRLAAMLEDVLHAIDGSSPPERS